MLDHALTGEALDFLAPLEALGNGHDGRGWSPLRWCFDLAPAVSFPAARSSSISRSPTKTCSRWAGTRPASPSSGPGAGAGNSPLEIVVDARRGPLAVAGADRTGDASTASGPVPLRRVPGTMQHRRRPQHDCRCDRPSGAVDAAPPAGALGFGAPAELDWLAAHGLDIVRRDEGPRDSPPYLLSGTPPSFDDEEWRAVWPPWSTGGQRQ